jgi:hypothetical protein
VPYSFMTILHDRINAEVQDKPATYGATTR